MIVFVLRPRAARQKDCYKIKLRTVGYRLVDQVDDKVVLVTIIVVGKREKGLVYRTAAARNKK